MSDTVHFPCFTDAEGQVTYLPFCIAAVAYHIGHTPNTGHHRTALRYHGKWLVYDDNKLPDQLSELSDDILRNITMLWLIQPNDIAVRTMHRQTAQLPSLERPTPASLASPSAASNEAIGPNPGALEAASARATGEPTTAIEPAAKRSRSDAT